MEVLFSEEDLEPVSVPDPHEQTHAAPAAPRKNAPRPAPQAPAEGSLFGDLEEALGLEPVFAPAPVNPFGAPPPARAAALPVPAEATGAFEALVSPELPVPAEAPDRARRPRSVQKSQKARKTRGAAVSKAVREAPAPAEATPAPLAQEPAEDRFGGAKVIRSPEDLDAFDVLREDGTVLAVDADTCADPEVFEAERRRRGRGAKQPRSIMTRAVDALSRREYSRRDLGRKLLQNLAEGETREEVVEALDRLEQLGLLSDERYAEMKVRASAGRMGDLRLRRELRMSGVSAEAIENALAEVEEPEEVRAWRIWSRRWSEPPENWKEREKMVRYLAARGFGMSAIQKVIRGEVELSEEQY
ncbi:regulatory protein RecX [uncultured Sutterella sp.]|uniref:regulatory protein RecX n=1 Tax=uncultured Sutterella sp. TaxID=286133 RepID=UPI0025E86CA4|nr:regulatory protein RecX [uncultured Sutterella sp.]